MLCYDIAEVHEILIQELIISRLGEEIQFVTSKYVPEALSGFLESKEWGYISKKALLNYEK